jgi:hypothetical protein
MTIRYGDLTDAQRALVCNGCGAKGGFINPPEFRFGASCDHHDFNYWIGGDDSDRLRADRQFFRAMLDDARELPQMSRYAHVAAAWIYFRSVRLWGGGAFHYGTPRTARDLLKLLLSASVPGVSLRNIQAAAVGEV